MRKRFSCGASDAFDSEENTDVIIHNQCVYYLYEVMNTYVRYVLDVNDTVRD